MNLFSYDIVLFHQCGYWVSVCNMMYFFRSMLAYVLITCSMVYFNI